MREKSHEGLDHAKVCRYDRSDWRVGCFRDHIRLREPDKSIEADGRKRRGSAYESKGTQLPKSQAMVRMEVYSEECHSAIEANLPIAKKGTQMQGNG
ncbi:hypothetical protein B296_00003200 [Ensete ventricosum]|uniref:Uncharacterized protein n=1 Tax=Ensete ventricosum TaxID=4639 RepID=A0A427B8S0_ENSVE|nr:hypothetical protein B296_00003200 [Ensete ventricosum]